MEEVIIKRIKDGLFDDVERQVKMSEDTTGPRVALDHEKSKDSLGDIYAKVPRLETCGCFEFVSECICRVVLVMSELTDLCISLSSYVLLLKHVGMLKC